MNLNVVEEPRLLYNRKDAARQLSISIRYLDYLIANKRLSTRKVGKRKLVPRCELVRFSRADQPDSIATLNKKAKAGKIPGLSFLQSVLLLIAVQRHPDVRSEP